MVIGRSPPRLPSGLRYLRHPMELDGRALAGVVIWAASFGIQIQPPEVATLAHTKVQPL